MNILLTTVFWSINIQVFILNNAFSIDPAVTELPDRSRKSSANRTFEIAMVMSKSALSCGTIEYSGHWGFRFFSIDHLRFEDRKQTYGIHKSRALY